MFEKPFKFDYRPPGYRRESPGFGHAYSTGPLTDRKIKRYLKQGFYANRNLYRAELKKKKAEKDFLPRLIYDCEKQDFI